MIQLHSKTKSRQAVYLAFRAGFVTAFQRLLADFGAGESSEPVLLERLPIAKGCASQVQMALLLQTWDKLRGETDEALKPEEECLCYCAMNELAIVASEGNEPLLRQILNGPKTTDQSEVLWIASKIRLLQVTWPYELDSAELVRDAQLMTGDLDEKESPQYRSLAVSALLNLVGEWKISPRLLLQSEGLITESERETLGAFFQANSCLMNL